MVKKTNEEEKPATGKKVYNTPYLLTVGRRKQAIARVRLYSKGTGAITVNNKPIDAYFGGEASKSSYMVPFVVTNTIGKFDITIRVTGGGPAGQLGAVIHGMTRAIEKFDKEKFRAILKSNGLLTRDPRVKERRKVGMGGKSRRKKQSPKR